MGVSEIVFTAEDVNALVPRLDALVAKLHATARRLQEEREHVRDGGGPSTEPSVEELVRLRPAARRLVEDMQAATDEIAALGGELRDLRLGLVDFPSVHAGEPILLCWQYGEPEVAFWHRDGEGFSGRKRLPGRHRDPRLQ